MHLDSSEYLSCLVVHGASVLPAVLTAGWVVFLLLSGLKTFEAVSVPALAAAVGAALAAHFGGLDAAAPMLDAFFPRTLVVEQYGVELQRPHLIVLGGLLLLGALRSPVRDLMRMYASVAVMLVVWLAHEPCLAGATSYSPMETMWAAFQARF